jgi:hypothetical protein
VTDVDLPAEGAPPRESPPEDDAPLPDTVPTEDPPEYGEDVEPGVTPAQMRLLQPLFVEAGVRGPERRHAYLAQWLGRPVESTNDLTVTEASAIIDRLQRQVATDG